MITLLFALAVQTAPIDLAAPWVPEAPPASVVATWRRLETDCRGGDARTAAEACPWRDKLVGMMRQAGWCRGPQALPAYRHVWRRCVRQIAQ